MAATLERFRADERADAICAAIDRDGAAIVEHLFDDSVVAEVNDELDAAVDAADPGERLFDPVLSEFHGTTTRQVTGAAAISRTFAVDVMCHPLLLAICDRVLLPACARYQLNIGHVLERGPGAQDQWLHRDEAVWSDVPWPHPELQLASVIAFADFTRDNGATRVVPGSHRWSDRALAPAEQMSGTAPGDDEIAYAEMAAGSAVVYSGGTLHGGGANRSHIGRRGAHLSYCLGWLRTEENNYLAVPPPVAGSLPRRVQELLGYAMYDGLPRGGGYLGTVGLQDPVTLLERGDLA